MNIRPLAIVLMVPKAPIIFSAFIPSVISIGSFLMTYFVFKFIISFLHHIHLLLSPPNEIFILVFIFFISTVSILSFPFLFGSSFCFLFNFYFNVYHKNACNCMFQHILKSLSDNSSIYVGCVGVGVY